MGTIQIVSSEHTFFDKERSQLALLHGASVFLSLCEMADFVKRGSVQLVKRSSVQIRQAAKEVRGL